MTKFFEEYIRYDIDRLDELEPKFKGELTLVISENKSNKKDSQNLDESDKRIINKMINQLSIKEIINLINKEKKIPKKIIYNYCLKLKNEI